MSRIWIVMIALGVLTLTIRLSFVLLFGHWQPPEVVKKGFRYVPVAVLTAIFLPELLLQDGAFLFSLANPRLIAGLAAVFIAWRTKNALWTIALGMVVFWLLRAI
jgi:branched-subunit amino acid transport protein